ncbi:Otogelin-like protein [Lonchura striata]|uniref:Otogelin-like protein n=1 Tax=Lonchura striata TaxID=40157 RepID=A0A218VAL9_9PASE|nr:Otogelin-like protein [Lonchura striata domestica]
MIEGTPQLHANAWKVSSACSMPINIPVVDPCNVNQQNAGYASHCDIINQDVFAPCHAYISPGLYYQLCRFDACKCGSSCLCNALAHYAYVCGKHGVIIDFRSHVSYCDLAVIVITKAELSSLEKSFLWQQGPGSVCRRGVFNCTSYPCPAVCTIYGDRHYYTFDGLEYDYVSDCQTYLLKVRGLFSCVLEKTSTDNSNISIIAQNKKCFDNDIVCSKNVFITVGETEIYFSEPSEKQKTLGAQDNKSNYQLWKAGYYTVIHFPEQDITVLWDKKTMMHVKVGPRWKGKLAGLCGNFDKYTSNDLTTSNNMEVRNAQVFGDSWVLGQCKSPNETLRPCEVHQSKFPYAKKECSILYSDLFAPCRNVIDVTSFIKNCHTDTCNCNLGGDCECLCTSIAAYAHKCCQQGAAIHWRSPLLCGMYPGWPCSRAHLMGISDFLLPNYINMTEAAYDCEYYNQVVFCENLTIFIISFSSVEALSLVSLESAERPNYFLCVHDNETIGLEQWQANASFQRRATFFHHQGLWSPGLSAFELHSKKGFFIILTSSSVKVEKYDGSEEFKHFSSFSIEEPSYVTSQTKSSSLTPIVSSTLSLTQNISATQASVSSLDTQGTSKIPIIDLATSVDFSKFTLKISLSTNLSAALETSIIMPSLLMPNTSEITLESQPSVPSPPPKTTHISNVSLGKQSSSVSSSEEDGTISAIPNGIITQSTTPTSTNTTVNATSSKAPYIYAKMLPSSSASLLVTSGTTTLASRITTKTTDSFVVNLDFYMASASVPTTIETQKSLFTTAVTQASQSARETPKINIMETTGTTNPLSQMKSTSYVASAVKYTTSFEKTVGISEDGQTSREQKNATKTKTTTTDKSSPPFLPVTALQSLLFSRNTTSVKNISTSGVLDVTTSDRSKIPTQKPITSYFTVTEATELQTRAIIDLSLSSGGMALPSSSETMAVADKAYFGTMMHTLISTSSECMPRYLEPVDKCSQYVCVNTAWMLYNLSRNCPKDVQKPDCGFRGMPVQVNTDSCCPEWECPCHCSVLSELSVITFDGNNIALCNMASYILVKLPGETIVAHIEKCPANQVVVDSVIQPLPFSKEGLSIQDTGAMYVVNTPAGISIKWAHVTGIIDIQYGLHSNTMRKTEGLCGFCNGDPSDDLKMQNMTVITNMEEIEVFIKSWEIEKSFDVTTRRPVRNCIEDNCTYCMELLNRSIFIPCHKKVSMRIRKMTGPNNIIVSPQEFCEKMWINSTNFWNYECDALSAYVALCNKHNICIKWRTPDYCCKQTAIFWTLMDRMIFFFLPACTDNKGQPHSAGEIWNGSMRGCCMYGCLENGSIIAVEPECSEDPPPLCEREGEVLLHVIEERACCPKKVCECNMSLCDAAIPTCKPNEKLVVGYHPLSCCPQYRCVFVSHPTECDPSVCFNASQPDCREDQFIVEAKQEDPCCFSHLCVCESCIEPVPLCSEGEILTVDLNTIHYCCPHYYCECSCENATMLTCKLGEVKKIDSSVSSACGCTHYICEKDDVCIFQEVTVLNPGQSVIQYLDGDLCYTVQCLQEKDQNTGYNAMHFTMMNCSQQCEARMEHLLCMRLGIKLKSFGFPNKGFVLYIQEGSTWTSNCTNYKCVKTAAGAIVLGSSVVCPPFNDTECTKVCTFGKNGGIVESYNDGCCKTCKKEERICQKMTIRTTIRKNDCISQSPVNVASCDGKCPSATIFNVNIDSHLRFCKCCREIGTRVLTVPLRCSGNGTEILYVIQEPIDCSCQWN